MTGIELAVGYLFAWLVRKAKHVAERADTEVDPGLDAGMDRLHDLVSEKLGQDPAMERARQEAEAGQPEPSERTRRRLTDSLEDAAERDQDFAQTLKDLVAELRGAAVAAVGGEASVSGEAQAISGSVHIHAEDGSAAALRMQNVTIGSPADPHRPGPERG